MAGSSGMTMNVWYSTDGLGMVNHLNQVFSTQTPPVHMIQHCVSELVTQGGDSAATSSIKGNNHLLIFTPDVMEYLRTNPTIELPSTIFSSCSSVLMLWGGKLDQIVEAKSYGSISTWPTVDPQTQDDFIDLIKQVMIPHTVRRKGGFRLYPATVVQTAANDTEILIVVNDEIVSKVVGRELFVQVATKTQSWDFPLKAIREGVFSFRPNLPECILTEQYYMVHVKFTTEGTLGSRRLCVLPQCGALNPVRFIAEAYGLDYDMEVIDQKLAQMFNKTVPLNFKDFFSENSSEGCKINKEIPTLLHLCARYNLKHLLNELMGCPGITECLEIYNNVGENAVDVAFRHKNTEVASVLESFQIYSVNYNSLRLYMTMSAPRYVQPNPAPPPASSKPTDQSFTFNDDSVKESFYMPMDRRRPDAADKKVKGGHAWRRTMSERVDKPKRVSLGDGPRANTLPEQDELLAIEDHDKVMTANLSEEVFNLSDEGRSLMESVKDGSMSSAEAVKVFKFFESKAQYITSSSFEQKQEILSELNDKYEVTLKPAVNRRPRNPRSPVEEATKSNKAVRNDRVCKGVAMGLESGGSGRDSKDSSYESDIDTLGEDHPNFPIYNNPDEERLESSDTPPTVPLRQPYQMPPPQRTAKPPIPTPDESRHSLGLPQYPAPLAPTAPKRAPRN